jgi:capsular polysaccharide biosynthesis protein
MDLYDYLQVMRRRWLVTAIGFLLTAGLTFAFVDRQPSIYESTGTFVVRPRTTNSADGLKAIDALTRGVEITTTFATVARSDLVKQRAEQRLDPDVHKSGLTVSSEVLTSTNVLEVTVRGGDPEATHALATAIGDETVAYVSELQTVYDLRVLDAPSVPRVPVAPKRRLLIGTGIVLGLVVGMLFALLAEGFARTPKRRNFDQQLSKALRNSGSLSYSYGDIDTSEEDDARTPHMTNGRHPDAAGDRRPTARAPGSNPAHPGRD